MARVVYSPNKRAKESLLTTYSTLFKNIVESKELIIQLYKRDFLMMYKKSFLGMGWLLISPLMGIVSWVFMNSAGVLDPGDVGIPYPAYVLISTSLFGLFMNFFSGASNTLNVAKGFILQVNFPHDALLMKQSMQQITNFLITFVVAIVLLISFGVYPDWKVALLPIYIIPIFCLASALGIIVSVITVVTPDLQKGISFLMSLLIYITPIIYAPKVSNPYVQKIIDYNPLTYIIGGARDYILFGSTENFTLYLVFSLTSIFLFMLAMRLFYISEEKVIEKLL